MKFIKGMPNIKIFQNDNYMLEIKTVQKFDEDEDRIILKCAEEISEFKRGFICDIETIYIVESDNGDNVVKELSMRNDIIKNLVLVYMNKCSQFGYITEFEYIFYK